MRRALSLALLLSGCFIEPLDEARLEIQVEVMVQRQVTEGACARAGEILDLEGCGAWLRLEVTGSSAPTIIEQGVAAESQTLSFSLDLDPGPQQISLLGYLPGDPTRVYGAEAQLTLEAGQIEALELSLERLPTGEITLPDGAARAEILDLKAGVRFEAAGDRLDLPERRYEISALDSDGVALKQAVVTPEAGEVSAL